MREPRKPTSEDRAIALGDLINVRDMGGLGLGEGSSVRPGALLRGESPLFSGSDVWQPLAELGVRTVLDLRAHSEPRYEVAAGTAIELVTSPLFDFDFETVLEEWDGEIDVVAFYIHVLDVNEGAIAAAARAIARAEPGGVYVHCRMGKDRTGLLLALMLEAVGGDRGELAADYGLSADNLAERLAAWSGEGLSERNVLMRRKLMESREEQLLAVLDHVDQRYGGPRAYLLANGLAAEDLDAFRRRIAAVDPTEDLVHPPRGEDPKWRESYYWDLLDPANELMLYATFGKRPQRGRSGFLIALWDSARDELLAGQEIDTFEVHDNRHRIAGLGLECLEPFRRWRMWFEGELVRCPHDGRNRFAEPRRIPAERRELVPVSFDVEFECVGEPRVYEPAEGWTATFDGHHEQATLASGTLTVDGESRRLEALPGIRDHSWGRRDWHGVTESRWVAAALEGDTDISLMRQVREDGTVVLDGALYRGGDADAVTAYEETVEWDEGVDPPEARRIEMRLASARGVPVEVSGEVRAMLPIVFADPTAPGRVTWNDRSFVAFTGKDGRRGFGTVEFQRLLEDIELT
ncbi:MAG: tyrosine-protein phosphatase [Solirubrobacterales bacterium]